MCLSNNKEQVQAILNSGLTYLPLYKEVSIKVDKKGRKFLSAPLFTFEYKPGWNGIKKHRKLVTRNRHICVGIHVSTRTRCSYDKYNYVISVRCYLKDLVGTDGENFVFNKIWISKSEYDKVMK